MKHRYGPLGFAAALLNMLLAQAVTWFFLPWFYLAMFILPLFFLADLGVAAALGRGRGKEAEIGWGMFIGGLSAPLSVVVAVPAFLIAKAIGPI